MSADYDVDRVRAHFPQVAGGMAFFDGPGGTQTPVPVADAIRDALVAPLSNRWRGILAGRNADDLVLGFRSAMADFLAVDPGGVVYGRSMTQLTMDTARALAREWGPGDEIVLTRLEHDANVRPWVIAAERVGATVRWADPDPETGELPVSAVTDQLSDRTRLVAITAASNLIGTMPDLPAIAAAVHEHGALMYVDAVHYAAHELVDMEGLGADLLACSPYKFLGPHCGVLAGRPEVLQGIHPDKLLPSTEEVPERFELGTLPYEAMAGVTAAVDFLADLVPGEGSRRERLERSYAGLHEHEDRLRVRIEEGLGDLPGEVTLWSRAARRTPTLTFTIAGRDLIEGSTFLAERGVSAPSDAFYAHELAQVLALGDDGGMRVGLAPYTSDADVDLLLESLTDWLRR
ncbi:cysteine desulfurase-like protein [Nocardioides rotundus]|uniref:cysteine desulfurase-like protein n=1 Tax=Nocardioides rotundus TaxID=1774216 RepID=UPI001CBEF9F7|nr:cysteine desulfurase-like protein [Nocardioides rotundus]UAL30785.1 cysteine desulfurase-like protein [Nocardioides rotundus]